MIVRENLEDLKNSLSIKPEKLGLKHTINKKPLCYLSLPEEQSGQNSQKGFREY